MCPFVKIFFNINDLSCVNKQGTSSEIDLEGSKLEISSVLAGIVAIVWRKDGFFV